MEEDAGGAGVVLGREDEAATAANKEVTVYINTTQCFTCTPKLKWWQTHQIDHITFIHLFNTPLQKLGLE